jgi:hypothetical protein
MLCHDSLLPSPTSLESQPSPTLASFSHPSFSYKLLFPTPPIKLKLGLQEGGRLLIATHLDQWNYLPNQKHQGAVDKHDFTLSPFRPFHGLWTLKPVHIFKVPAVFQWIDSLDLTDEPHTLLYPYHVNRVNVCHLPLPSPILTICIIFFCSILD